MGEPALQGGNSEPQAGGTVTNIVTLHLQPIHLDLLGLALRVEESRLTLDAESGAGRLLGNLVQQLLHAFNRLDLAPVVDEFMGEAQGTLKSFAHLASGRKLEQGTEVAKILAGMAGHKAGAGLRRLFGRGAPRPEAQS